jgi:4-hydroxy-2-oxoheptanedioate aldolase
MIRVNPMKKGLKEGESYIGTFAKISDPSVVEIFALSGFDYFIIDNEHSQMGKESMVNLLRASDISGIVPIVRVRENNRAQILQALDGGGLGIMVPETNSALEVKHVVDSALYAPEGCRGYTASNRAAGYGSMDAADYARLANENMMVIVYCETQAAIDNIDKILAVPHVDVLWMGPMDLSQALGVTGNPKHPKVTAAMDMIIDTCKKAGIASGTIAPDVETTKDLLRRGVQLIGLSSDQAMISYAGRKFLKEIRE